MKIYPSVKLETTCLNVADTLGLYAIEERLGYVKFLFDEGFVHLVRYAFSTDCTSEMSTIQLEFLNNYIDWINTSTNVSDGDLVYQAFDEYLTRLTGCEPDPTPVICGNSNTHSYAACP